VVLTWDEHTSLVGQLYQLKFSHFSEAQNDSTDKSDLREPLVASSCGYVLI